MLNLWKDGYLRRLPEDSSLEDPLLREELPDEDLSMVEALFSREELLETLPLLLLRDSEGRVATLVFPEEAGAEVRFETLPEELPEEDSCRTVVVVRGAVSVRVRGAE